MRIEQTTVLHGSLEKLVDDFIDNISGGERMVEGNICVRSDEGVTSLMPNGLRGVVGGEYDFGPPYG